MGKCKPNYTVVFVCFDLEEYGTQGSLAFVQDFLVPYLVEKMNFPGIQGAYILDSIMSYNSSEGSQQLPNDYIRHMPVQSAEIENDGRKGDFIALIGR